MAPIRARGGTAAAVSVGGFVLLLAVIPTGLLPVPNRNRVYGPVWPLISLVWTIPYLAYAQLWTRPLERVAQRSLWVGACALIAVVSGLAMSTAFAQTELPDRALIRDYFVVAGVALGSCAITPSAAWLPVVIAAAATWLFGPVGFGDAHGWALILRPGEEATAMAAILFVAGAGAYLIRAAAADAALSWTMLHRPRPKGDRR